MRTRKFVQQFLLYFLIKLRNEFSKTTLFLHRQSIYCTKIRIFCWRLLCPFVEVYRKPMTEFLFLTHHPVNNVAKIKNKTFFSGHGEVRVNGGNGANQGFGGAGGRIAVRAGWKYDFPGEDRRCDVKSVVYFPSCNYFCYLLSNT